MQLLPKNKQQQKYFKIFKCLCIDRILVSLSADRVLNMPKSYSTTSAILGGCKDNREKDLAMVIRFSYFIFSLGQSSGNLTDATTSAILDVQG